MAVLPNKAVLLYDDNNVAMAVQNGVAIPANTSGVLAVGSDGTTARNLLTTATGVLKTAPVGTRTLLGVYGAATLQIAGTVAAQNLLSIENPVASGKVVYVRRITISGMATASVAVNYQYLLGRTTAVPTGGTTLTAQKRQTADAAAAAIVRQAPTATAAAGSIWAGSGFLSSASATIPAGQLSAWDSVGNENDDIVLAAGEGLLVSAGGNATNARHSIALVWEET